MQGTAYVTVHGNPGLQSGPSVLPQTKVELLFPYDFLALTVEIETSMS